MTPELFVGPLSSYYEGSWRVPQPPFARSERRPHDTQMVRIYVLDLDQPAPQPTGRRAELQSIVETWCGGLNERFGSALPSPLDWDEGSDMSAAAQPDPHALKLWAASLDYPDIRQRADWRSMDPGFEVSPRTTARFAHILDAPDFWLPAPFDFSIPTQDPMGKPALLGSTSSLLDQLDDLNALFWDAPLEDVETWNLILPGSEASLEKVVRYSFCEMYLATRLALENDLPMKFDAGP